MATQDVGSYIVLKLNGFKDVGDHIWSILKIYVFNCVGLMEHPHVNLNLLPTYVIEHLPLH